ncbi:UDP-N-acetylmuramoyl-tripeptide--D-alanyl-D-alanine ligase [Flavobacterium agrisoli]|uniref:UDP-N-acetylmuramoyl-tripeptide--D-alanyl-D-alanine ligase n=1 Tax=Flavobacterium agrisoli TaxID=2793066 RepID=A0A934UKZ4_9FLAO|nr:UDP-N-acetylmuramoyl-tripeptide--D-alanyl-D-alanine ligase [Flavobacterium agrisoli]MBK0371024.1 UDP-N-acetylmuramoyl-tripeptide--D-alanyl-D-alanine ligase [Flavobacterium agrisoli]
MEIEALHKLFLECSALSTDTRKIEKGSMFVAIKGEKFNANTFAAEALQKGASYVVIDDEAYYIDQRTILVKDGLNALQELAKYHRQFLNIPIISLTGSNGKTTTKELIHVVLSKKFKTKATVGNLNNHIGVPLTLLSFTQETEIGIVEMGANHQKEIAFLCEIAQPDYGYITNFGKAHLEGFGGVEGVIKGKSEMYSYLKSTDKIAFVNLDDVIQAEKTAEFKRFTFAKETTAVDVKIDAIEANPFVTVTYEATSIKSNLIGIYNANNLNAALAMGIYFKIPIVEIQEALEGYVPENNRSQLLTKGSNQIILDAYNANPSSMAAAIDNFLQLDLTNKYLILGDMFELGDESALEHKKLVQKLASQSEATCFFVGKAFYENQFSQDNIKFFETFDTFAAYFKSHLPSNASLLIKGSRGMALERTLELL